MEIFMRSFKMFIFGLKVFFNKITLKNLIQISHFIFKRYIMRKKIPVSVVFAITYRCQCSCIHCSVGDYEEKNEMTEEEIKRAILSIKKLGAVKITFFGGEPLVRKDIYELVRFATDCGIRSSIDTNGIFLTEEVLIKLKEAGIANINVSIDSADAKIHDYLRKYDGCFNRAVDAIKICVKHKIPVIVSTYASKRSLNNRDLEKIILLAKNLKASGVKVLFPILSGKWRRKEDELLSEKEVNVLMKLIDPSFVYIEDALEMIKSNAKGCSAVKGNLIYISPSGEIQPCPAVPLSFGNIREKNIDDIITLIESKFSDKHKNKSGCIMNNSEFRKEIFSSSAKYPFRSEDR